MIIRLLGRVSSGGGLSFFTNVSRIVTFGFFVEIKNTTLLKDSVNVIVYFKTNFNY